MVRAEGLQSYSIRGFSRARIKTLLAGVPLTTERRAGVSEVYRPPFWILFYLNMRKLLRVRTIESLYIRKKSTT